MSFLLVSVLLFCGTALGDLFPTPHFSGEDVTSKVFGSMSDEVFPIAYGDFNADKLTDIIAVANNRSSIMLFIAYEEAPFLRLGRKCDIKTADEFQKIEIIGAAPGDFTGDGVMDLLVTLNHDQVKGLEIMIFEGNSSDLICENHMGAPIVMAGEPLVVDLNGDMIMDLVSEVYTDPTNLEDTKKIKQIWIFDEKTKFHYNQFNFTVEKNKSLSSNHDRWERRIMSDPPSNAFVDVVGDTTPELVILTKDEKDSFYVHTYSVLRRKNEIIFSYAVEPIQLNSKGVQFHVVGQSVFVDFNQNGSLMQLLPYCSAEGCKDQEGIGSNSQGIKVVFNGNVTELPLLPASFENVDWGWSKTVTEPIRKIFVEKAHYYDRTVVLRVGDYNLECRQTPAVQERPPAVTIYESRIDLPLKSYGPVTGNVAATDAMAEEDKQNVFELLRDHILRPHGYDTTVFHNYATKAAWSPIPVYCGLNMENRCIIGVLTAAHELLIYGRSDRRFESELWIEPWECVLNMSLLYNEYLCKIWESEEKDPNEKTKFDIYKRRLYQLAFTNFVWIPDWNLGHDHKNTDEGKGVFTFHFITFHAQGDVCIWKLKASKTVSPNYSAKVVARKTGVIDTDDAVSSAAYLCITSQYGLLLIGTNRGKIISYLVETLKPSKKAKNDTEQLKYNFINEQRLWDDDMIRVENILIYPTSPDNKKMNVVAVKNPNILISTVLSLKATKVTAAKNFSIVKVPFGPIVGIERQSEDVMVLSHEPGMISLVSLKDGELDCIENSAVSIFDPQKSSQAKSILIGQSVQKAPEKLKFKPKKIKQLKDSEKRLIFQGLGISPNKTMLCIARTLGVYYDHLQIRKPTQIVFYSLLQPPETAWTTVQNLYTTNMFSLRGISDVLVPLRYALRSKTSNALHKEILDWAVPLEEKTIDELRLLLWCLKLTPTLDPAELEMAKAEKLFNPNSVRSLMAKDALNQHRIDIIVDMILQKRCASLIRAVLQNQNQETLSLDSELNKQSVEAIYTFLESKGNLVQDLPPKPKFNPPAKMSICFWCKGPLEFPLEHASLERPFEKDLEDGQLTKFDQQIIVGYDWKTRRHPVKEFGIHRPEICILSLVPLQFPYRRCSNCNVAAMLNPAFGQLPYCPLCGALMYPNQLRKAEDDFVKKSAQEETPFHHEETLEEWLAINSSENAEEGQDLEEDEENGGEEETDSSDSD